MPSLSALRSRVAALPGTARLTEALAVPSAEVVAAAPPGARHLVVSALAPTRTGAPVLAVTATGREAEDLAAALEASLAAGAVGRVPRLGDAAARAALPAQRHRRPAPRRCCAGWPTPRPATTPHGALSVVVAPVRAVLQPIVQGLGDLEPGRAPGRRRRAARAGRRGPRGGRLRPRRPGRAARRVRGARRHPRRLPAHRGAPAAGRVLGRHGRGDPLVQGRRPAQPRGRRARAVGAALPRAAAHRRGARARRARWPTQLPGAADMLEQARRGHRRRGHGVARAGPGRRHGAAARPAARRRPCSSLCDPERVRTRAHDLVATSAGVPRRRLGQRRERQRRADRPPVGARHRVVPHPGRAAPAGPRPRRARGRPHPVRR